MRYPPFIYAIAVVTIATAIFLPMRSAQANQASLSLKYSKELRFQSDGQWLPAIYYGAAGTGPHPTVILLHGYPGNEKNLDIAQGLRDAGFNVMFFHYRGAWGAQGEFSFMNAEADVQAAIHFLIQPANAQALRIDPAQLSLIGHSMGGHMAIAGISQNAAVRCAVAYDTANIGVTFSAGDAEREANWIAYGDSLFMLRGWSGEKSRAEVALHGDHLDLRNQVARIGGRPVLLVAADSEVIPIDRIESLVASLNKASVPVTYRVVEDDHSFNNNRQPLLDLTREFLDANCRAM
jgi:dienelactone hydrolase